VEGDGTILKAMNAGAAVCALKSGPREAILDVIRKVEEKGRCIPPEIALLSHSSIIPRFNPIVTAWVRSFA